MSRVKSFIIFYFKIFFDNLVPFLCKMSIKYSVYVFLEKMVLITN